MEEKVFKDPVHKYIYVQDQIIWDLINTQEFQRLRRIRQLGTSFFTFHGSEHSRFSHSLGVYEIARKIISRFERNGYTDWPEQDRVLALCAALLHDIGHGPFSHTFEHVFATNHEDWSCRVILEDTEVNRVLREFDAELPRRVADVICKTYPDSMITALISSQMDADRMDYLLRDAYFTGVHYGTFDLERILRVMRPHNGKIVIKESGMHAVEDYLMSRHQMYWQVYFHPVTRSAEVILRKIFLRAQYLYQNGYTFNHLLHPFPSVFNQTLSLQEYLLLDEAIVLTMFHQWAQEADSVLSDLCRRFMHRNLFKYVTLRNPDPKLLEQVIETFKQLGVDPEYYLELDYQSDLPYDMYQPGTEKKIPIYIINHNEELVEITAKSEIIRSISKIHRGDYQLFYPEDFIQGETETHRQLHRLLERL